MLDADLAFAGVARQAEMVRRGEVSACELVEVALTRIERFDPQLNCFGAVRAQRAYADAEEADRRRRSGEHAPLLGVPVAVKDEMDMAGEVTSRGTGAFSTPAAVDSEVIRRLKRAGAVIVGKTTMPELGLWPFTESVTWGVTRNPWDTDRTPGGSSGGSAAAVAAGLVPGALAADGAGSIRIPAACCGIFGLKPQRGRVPLAPHDSATGRWVVFGPLTRSVLDAALVLDAIRGPMPGDPAPPPEPHCSFADAARSAPPRLRVLMSTAVPSGTIASLSPDVQQALHRTAEDLRSLGHEVVEGDLGLKLGDTAVIVGLLFAGIRDLVEEVERPERLERRTRALARPGRLVPEPIRTRLRARERALAARLAPLFTEHDVLLMPVISRPAERAQAMEGRGATLTYLWETGWVPFTVLWNALGQPAASVPAGFSREGLPLAVQLVGRPDDETTLLSLSAQLESLRPWADRRPPVGS